MNIPLPRREGVVSAIVEDALRKVGEDMRRAAVRRYFDAIEEVEMRAIYHRLTGQNLPRKRRDGDDPGL